VNPTVIATPAERRIIEWAVRERPDIYRAAVQKVAADQGVQLQGLGFWSSVPWSAIAGAVGSIGSAVIGSQAQKDALNAQIKLAREERAAAESLYADQKVEAQAQREHELLIGAAQANAPWYARLPSWAIPAALGVLGIGAVYLITRGRK
jgi:hypothetical protein